MVARVARAFALVATAVLSLVMLLTADCQPARSGGGGSGSDIRPWNGRAAVLFDDSIAPEAAGVAGVVTVPRLDPVLRERAQSAEVVQRVRVSTVTIDRIGDVPTYHFVLAPLAAPVVGRTSAERIELSVDTTSPSFNIVRALETGLVGRSFIGFFRRFAGADEPQVHWRLDADTDATLAAVREATALQEVGAR